MMCPKFTHNDCSVPQDENTSIPKILNRMSHFNGWEVPSQVSLEECIYAEILENSTLEEIRFLIPELKEANDSKEILRIVFSRVYDFENCQQHNKFSDLYDAILERAPHGIARRNAEKIIEDSFNACFFTSLCLFLNESRYKYSDDKSGYVNYITEYDFVYYNSPFEFSDPKSSNYFDKQKIRQIDAPQTMKNEYERFRTARARILRNRPVYHPDSSHAAINEFSEHEWKLYFLFDGMDENDIIADTYKRLGNLNNSIYNLPSTLSDMEQARRAYTKYQNKLDKIKYENVAKVYSLIWDHIKNGSKCYGIDLYRFERRLRPYNITNEMVRLINCKTDQEENELLLRTMLLSGICYPKMYEHFFQYRYTCDLPFLRDTFLELVKSSSCSSLLVYDALIEEGLLGNNWKQDFCDTINELTSDVFYDPDKLVYPIGPKAQDAFDKVIAYPCHVHINAKIMMESAINNAMNAVEEL